MANATRPQFVGEAIERDEAGLNVGQYHEYVLKPACQPIYRAIGGDRLELVAYEGLIRPEENGLPVAPDIFFASLVPGDHLFIEMLCTALHIRSYRQAQTDGISLFLNVNVANFETVKKLEREVFYTLDRLSRHGLGNHNLVVEIVETEVLDATILHRVCEIMRESGIRFALDDFGTKASNVERYLDVQPDIVKIDRSVFRDFVVNSDVRKFVGSIVKAFQANGAEVLLEGLETPDEVQVAAEMGSDLFQGFALGMPAHIPCSFARTIAVPESEPRLPLRQVG